MTIEEEFDKLLKQFHKLSDRHILVAETDMSCSDIQKVVELSDRIRKAGNELVGLMKKNYDQLMRTKRYRGLLGNKSSYSNRLIPVFQSLWKYSYGVRLQAKLGSKNPTGLPVGVVRCREAISTR